MVGGAKRRALAALVAAQLVGCARHSDGQIETRTPDAAPSVTRVTPRDAGSFAPLWPCAEEGAQCMECCRGDDCGDAPARDGTCMGPGAMPPKLRPGAAPHGTCPAECTPHAAARPCDPATVECLCPTTTGGREDCAEQRGPLAQRTKGMVHLCCWGAPSAP